MNVAAEVRAEIAKQGIEISYLAEVSGIPRGRLSNRLNEHREFTLAELNAIGTVLGVPGWEFHRRATKEKTAA